MKCSQKWKCVLIVYKSNISGCAIQIKITSRSKDHFRSKLVIFCKYWNILKFIKILVYFEDTIKFKFVNCSFFVLYHYRWVCNHSHVWSKITGFEYCRINSFHLSIKLLKINWFWFYDRGVKMFLSRLSKSIKKNACQNRIIL